MKWLKISPRLLAMILVAVFCGIALFFRVVLPYHQIFVNEWIKFSSNDAYFQMRLVDNLVHNFPHLNQFDPYSIYPGGDTLDRLHFFNWLLAGVIWLIGLGSPSLHTVDVVGVYFPAVLGALAVIPVYFIGRELFNRWAGLLAAALMVVLPGEFLGRSILGFTDQHVAETLFSSIAVLWLIMTIKAARQRQLSFDQLRRGDRQTIARPLVYALFAGFSLGIYLITWGGGLLFVFIISLYFVIQFVFDHLRRQSVDYLSIIGAVIFVMATVVTLPFSPGIFYLVSLFAAVLIPLLAGGLSRLMAGRRLKPGYYPLVMVGLGLAGLGIFYLVRPALLGLLLGKFSIFFPSGTLLTTLEAQPILFPQGNFTFRIAWGNFTTGIFISLLVLLYLIISQWIMHRQHSAERNLLLIWSLVMLLATLAQRRFAYYFVVNVAVLTGYAAWQAIWFSGLKKLADRPAEAAEKPVRKKQPQVRSKAGVHRLNVSMAAFVVLLVVYLPNGVASAVVAPQVSYAPSNAWYSSMTWLKENSPEPFGDAGYYYQRYQKPPPGEPYNYPASAYGVTAWWDYGYWITRIAHRLPSDNPGQMPGPIMDVAHLFLAQDEATIREIMAKLDSSYIVADMATATSKYWAVVTWAGGQETDYSDVYYLPLQGQMLQVPVYFSEYYRSMYTRLYNFDGKAVVPASSTVVSYAEKVTNQGQHYKQIVTIRDFTTYDEASQYVNGQTSGNYQIVGVNPFASPVPLEALPGFELVYSSAETTEQAGVGQVPDVKIFQYIR